ncbi:MAG: SOS response-associated peptidase [Bacteroidota bacterium]
MCYRAQPVLTLQKLKEQFEIFRNLSASADIDDHPRFNALRFDLLPIIAHRDHRLQAFKAQWWLVPEWSRDGKTTVVTFNARAEGIETSKLYGPYLKSSRCLFPVEGFFEDRRVEEPVESKERRKAVVVKYPYYIRTVDERPFMLAGLYAVWVNRNTGEEIPSFSVITTRPNELMSGIHNRMPVILEERNFERWLDPLCTETPELRKLLVPFPSSGMKAHPVSREHLYYYSRGERHDDPDCLKEVQGPAS